MAVEQVDLLTGEGLDPERVVIGHIDNHPELDYVRRVLDRGVSVGFDSVGKQDWDVRVPPRPGGPDGPYAKAATRQSDTTQVDRLARLVADGYAGQILLPQDLAGAAVIYPDGADHHCWWADTPQQEHDALAGLAALLDQHPDLRVVTWADGAADIPRMRAAAARHDLPHLAAAIAGRPFDAWLWAHNGLRLPTLAPGPRQSP